MILYEAFDFIFFVLFFYIFFRWILPNLLSRPADSYIATLQKCQSQFSSRILILLFYFRNLISFFPAFSKSFHPLLCPYAVINFSFTIHKNLSAFCPPYFPLCLVPFLFSCFTLFYLILPPFSCSLSLNASLFSPVPLFLPFQYLAAYFQSIFLHSFTIIFNNAI